MADASWLWALYTLVAATAQTVRNATQRDLTASLGTVGATHVRFLFGFPFALAFLATALLAFGEGLPQPPSGYWLWTTVGALAQILATALMLAAMNDRSFVVVYACIKTEPVQAALFGLVFLGDAVTPGTAAAILILAVPSYLMAATFTLVIGLILQAALLSIYLWVRQPAVLRAIIAAWRPSLLAGFMGALASQFWFL